MRHGGSVPVRKRRDEEYSSFLVQPHLTFDCFRNLHLDRITPGAFRDFVDDLLGKGVEQQRTVAVPSTNDRVKGLAPASPVVFLAVRPGADDGFQRLEVGTKALFVSVDGASCGVPARVELARELPNRCAWPETPPRLAGVPSPGARAPPSVALPVRDRSSPSASIPWTSHG